MELPPLEGTRLISHIEYRRHGFDVNNVHSIYEINSTSSFEGIGKNSPPYLLA